MIVELDNDHSYLANFAYSSDAGGNMPPSTADEIELCELSSTDGSKHYAFRYKGTRYVALFVH